MTQDHAKTKDRSPRNKDANASKAYRPLPLDPEVQGAGPCSLGRYRVVEEIGVGGMASVHLARMDGPGGFEKWVAIKRIHPHLVAEESFVEMFLDEARIVARISHPNVATVLDFGRSENTYWIAMEYLHGEPLGGVMRRTREVGGPMPPELASRIIADAALGLHCAHELRGKDGEKLHLIHRDVTPHNLFVTYDGATKVVDFGIAKCSSRMSSTRAGMLKGKLAYMSPEQVHGEEIDRRTDVFALGVVLWELSTGRRLFRGENDLGTLERVRECDVPKPSSIVGAYPIDLESVVMKALAKNREERFPTARELSRALQSVLMRRGLLIGGDEVASYVQFLFRDRIRRREAHLRRAGTAPAVRDPSLAPTLARYTGGPQRTAIAHARTAGFCEDSADEAVTLVNRCVSEEHSLQPVARLAQRIAECEAANRAHRAARPRQVPVWAAAALSGALALLPASGIFVGLSRALRASPPSSTPRATSQAPHSGDAARSPLARAAAPSSHPIWGEAEGGAPAGAAAPSRASLMEDLGACTPPSCAP